MPLKCPNAASGGNGYAVAPGLTSCDPACARVPNPLGTAEQAMGSGVPARQQADPTIARRLVDASDAVLLCRFLIALA